MDQLQKTVGPRKESISRVWEDEASLPLVSGQIVAEYEGVLADLGIDGRVEEADCRRSACRVSMWFGSGEEAMRFRMLAGEHREGTEVRIDAVGEFPSADGELGMEWFIPTDLSEGESRRR